MREYLYTVFAHMLMFPAAVLGGIFGRDPFGTKRGFLAFLALTIPSALWLTYLFGVSIWQTATVPGSLWLVLAYVIVYIASFLVKDILLFLWRSLRAPANEN